MYLNLKAKLCLPQHFRFSDENKSFVHIFLITLLGVEDGGQFDLEEELGVIVIENVNTELEKKNHLVSLSETGNWVLKTGQD